MQCPYCGYSNSHVIDTRDAGDGIRRRRECLQCGLRYTTYERVQTTALMVLKRDTRREEYNHQKLLNSIRVACAKRPLPTGAIERIVADIEEQLQGLGRSDVPSPVIGEMVMERLRKLDRVAYIRFASVYRDFEDLETFRDEVDAMLSSREQAVPPENQGALFSLDEGKRRPQRRGRPPKQQSPAKQAEKLIQ